MELLSGLRCGETSAAQLWGQEQKSTWNESKGRLIPVEVKWRLAQNESISRSARGSSMRVSVGASGEMSMGALGGRSTRASVGASAGTLVGASVGVSMGASRGGSVRASVGTSEGTLVGASRREIRKHGQREQRWCAVSASDASVGSSLLMEEQAPVGNAKKEQLKEQLKLKILSLVAGLDRGVAATASEAQRVLQAVEDLEAQANLLTFQLPDQLDPSTSTSNSTSSSTSSSSTTSTSVGNKDREGVFGLREMQGLWRLVFSSGFVSGSLGGLRPGPPTGRLPILVGQVLQRIDIYNKELDNIVELRLGVLPWPLPAVEVTATLAHSFDVLGDATIRIVFEKTSVKAGDYDSESTFLPTLSTPEIPEFLKPPSPTRSGQFETTYLDNDFRVSRGDLGELRIFVRA